MKFKENHLPREKLMCVNWVCLGQKEGTKKRGDERTEVWKSETGSSQGTECEQSSEEWQGDLAGHVQTC